MFAEERRDKIVEILNDQDKVTVKALSLEFDISEVIIRKDLKQLEEQGKLIRTHGGAIKRKRHVATITIEKRVSSENREKIEIAKKAMKEIKENSVIFLDTTSISVEIAKLLPESFLKITVISNMLEVINLLADTAHINLICTGGVLHAKLGAFYGTDTVSFIKNYNVDKLFLGCAGINLAKNTLSNFDLEEGSAKQAMIDSSDEVIIVSESKKFSQDGIYNFSNINKAHLLITDKKISKEDKQAIEKIGVVVK